MWNYTDTVFSRMLFSPCWKLMFQRCNCTFKLTSHKEGGKSNHLLFPTKKAEGCWMQDLSQRVFFWIPIHMKFVAFSCCSFKRIALIPYLVLGWSLRHKAMKYSQCNSLRSWHHCNYSEHINSWIAGYNYLYTIKIFEKRTTIVKKNEIKIFKKSRFYYCTYTGKAYFQFKF